MIAIIKTNNPVTMSFARSVLQDSDIGFFMADVNASILEGSVGAILIRLMIIDEDEADARKALIAAGLEKELEPPSK
ncbi:MAG: hypothetical protein COA43_09625 [Robiginitomaculum sp.]|nr:MAG: hypothetical protein COA43_09625 [Robiginitomaculum sp.]